MGSGFKFHMATIMAIFLALAVGLGIGSLFISPIMLTGLEKANTQIRKDLKLDMTEKSAEISRYEEFLEGAMPALLRGRLDGTPIALIQTGDYTEAASKVQDTLRLAGARVVSTTVIKSAFDRPDDAFAEIVSQLHADAPALPSDRKGLIRQIATTLAHGDHSEIGVMQALEKVGLVSTDGDGDYKGSVRHVVVIAGSRTDPGSRISDIDKALIASLEHENVSVVMCEPKGVALSDIPAYRALDIGSPAISEVDADTGKIALVFALRNEFDVPGVQTVSTSGAKEDHP